MSASSPPSPIAVELLGVSTGDAVVELIPRLLAALDGSAPALMPTTRGGGDQLGANDGWDPDLALVVSTSGSSGAAKQVLLSREAVRYAAIVGQQRLSPEAGTWLLALPAQHIAGLMVLIRSGLAGREPVVLDTSEPFTVARFVAATEKLTTAAAFVSLVPTQLYRLLGDDAGRDSLRRFTAVLVGGAATGPDLIAEAREDGVEVVTSYGMSETCGGCVYDGRPLDGVDVTIDGDRRVVIAGPVVADGYLGVPFDRDSRGHRQFRTSDLGRIGDDGRLQVLGRADDVIISGGVNVLPQVVEEVLAAVAGVSEVLITGVADVEWGQVLVAVVVPSGTPPTLGDLRAAASAMGPAAMPRYLLIVDALPLRGPGKPDRRAVAVLATERLTGGPP